MRQHPAVYLLLSAALFLSMGAQGSKTMYEPLPIAVPEGLTRENISKAISDTLTGRKWSIDEVTLAKGEEQSEILATLHVRTHQLSIKFLFDEDKIEIHYVQSTNLQYREKKGKKYIHPKYTQWINNLEFDLKANLRK
jgi:hypothetical protein